MKCHSKRLVSRGAAARVGSGERESSRDSCRMRFMVGDLVLKPGVLGVRGVEGVVGVEGIDAILVVRYECTYGTAMLLMLWNINMRLGIWSYVALGLYLAFFVPSRHALPYLSYLIGSQSPDEDAVNRSR